MTFPYARDERHRGTNADLLASPADWISPNPAAADGYDYRTNPPPADGSKVILSDTDHLWGIGGNPDWVWKSFMRGHNPIFMDPYDNQVLGKAPTESWDPVRASMGHTRRLAEQLDLASMTPRKDLVSTGYCLAAPTGPLVAYLPDGGQIEVDLSGITGQLTVTWLSPLSGETHADKPINADGKASLQSPLTGPAVLCLRSVSN